MPTPTKKKRVRLSVAERREQLLQHAQALFAEQAYDEVSIAEVAKAAGVSAGLVFHYFENKRGLFLAALADAADVLVDSTVMVTAKDDLAKRSPEARLAALIGGLEQYLAFVEARAFAFRFLHSSGLGSDPKVAEILRRTRERFAERILVDQAAVTGRTGPPPPKLRYLALGWTSMVETITLLWLDDRAVSRTDLAHSLAAAGARLFG